MSGLFGICSLFENNGSLTIGNFLLF